LYQRLAHKIAGKPEERILAHLMLRSLKQARYSEKNEGHFALATSHYTHFTSPIRRYPDLIVHRISKALLHAGVSGHVLCEPEQKPGHRHKADTRSGAKNLQPTVAAPPPLSTEDLSAIAKESSDNERRAAEAERELIEWKKVKFMQHRIGEDFDAMVMNVMKYGLFVELTDLFIEGLVPIDSMHDDLYTYRENTREMIGSRSGKRYSIGDRLRVILDRVDEVERRLQFSILDDAGSHPAARSGKKKQKAAAKSTAKTEPARSQRSAKPPAKRGKLRRQPKGKRR
jgi:ribonuclease R